MNHTRHIQSSPQTDGSNRCFLRLDLAGTADSGGIRFEPTSLLLQCPAPLDPAFLPAWVQSGRPDRHVSPLLAEATILAHAPTHQVLTHPVAQVAQAVDLTRWIAIPGLVNAHTHLDLTSIGPQPFDPAAPFADWLGMVMAQRPADPQAIRASVQQGISLLLRGGCVAVGDIAGSPPGGCTQDAPLTLASSALWGTSFCEFFAIGTRIDQGLNHIRALLDALQQAWPAESAIRLGISPHAPYTVAPSAYRKAAASGLPLMTHLAESLDERLFIGQATGPQRELLESIGWWGGELPGQIGAGFHPIEHTLPDLDGCIHPPLVVHLNDLAQHDPQRQRELVERLSASGAGVVYCPRASAYFGAHLHLGPHPYQALMQAGIPVCLGTDSIINLPPDQADSISAWHDARLLVQRDGLDPLAALALITTAGAAALGLDPDRFTLKQGVCPAGLAVVPAPPAALQDSSISQHKALFDTQEPPILLSIGR